MQRNINTSLMVDGSKFVTINVDTYDEGVCVPRHVICMKATRATTSNTVGMVLFQSARNIGKPIPGYSVSIHVGGF